MLDDDINQSFLLDVLNLTGPDAERQADESLRKEACRLGIELEEGHKPIKSIDEQERGVEDTSIWSRRTSSLDSRSTGLTSHNSEFPSSQVHSSAASRTSKASLSFRDYDTFVARGRSDGRNSISFSSVTSPSESSESKFSLPLSQPPARSTPDPPAKKYLRRIRRLGGLRSVRADLAATSGTCPHCPHDLASQRRAVHDLPCGHRLCTAALRSTIKNATAIRTGAIPSCCGIPIPGNLVEKVMSEAERTALLDKLGQWDEGASITPSTMDDDLHDITPQPTAQEPLLSTSPTASGLEQDSLITPTVPPCTPLTPALQSLLATQSAQQARFRTWHATRQSALATRHSSLRDQLNASQQSLHDATLNHHGAALADAEDKQVAAEAALRATHAAELRDLRTALSHLEAHCAGVYRDSRAPTGREVSDQAVAERDRMRAVLAGLDARHEGAVRVLRGEQERRMALRCARQEREMEELDRRMRREELEVERRCSSERVALEEMVTARARKLGWRWELEVAVCLKGSAG